MRPAGVQVREPLPQASESVTVVEATTFAGALAASCDCTVTVNGLFRFGLTPPLMEVTASLVALETTKFEALAPVPAALVTVIGPVLAPAGTVAVIWPSLFTAYDAEVPLKATAVAPVKFEPKMKTEEAGAPYSGEKPVTAGAL